MQAKQLSNITIAIISIKFLELPVQQHFDHNTSLLQVPIVRIITYVRILDNECHKDLLKLKSNFLISCNMLHAPLTPV